MQVLNYVLEPFPWLLMTVYELFNKQQTLFVEKNPQEDKPEGDKQSWLSKTAQGQTTSVSDLSSTEGDGPARKAKIGSGDTPLHCACSNLNPADLPSIIEHVRLRARANGGLVAQLQRSSSTPTSRHRVPVPDPHSLATTLEHVGGEADITTANLLLRAFRSRRS